MLGSVDVRTVRMRWILIVGCAWLLPTTRAEDLSNSGIIVDSDGREISAEKFLCRELMFNYSTVGRNGRPVLNMSKPIAVEFGLGLIQMDLDEKNKILSTSMWSRYKWRDDYLQWNPENYAGIRAVKVQAEPLWKPDIMLYNTAETDTAERNVLAAVGADGTVLWVPHQIFRSSCSIDVLDFPFDYQTCHLWFGSWTHSIQDLDLQLAFASGIDTSTFMSDYKDSCAWEIVNSTAQRKALPEDAPTYVVLAFTLVMKRKMVFSTYILTLPCIFLATLTLLVFWLPPSRPDRTSLAMSIFGSFLVLLLILVEAAPPTASSVPRLGLYYCFNMVVIMLSIFLSTLVVNVHRGADGGQPVPRWLRLVAIQFLGRTMCIKSPTCRKLQKRDREDTRRPATSGPPQHTKYSRVNLNDTNQTLISVEHSLSPGDDSGANGVLPQSEAQQLKCSSVTNSLREMATTIVRNARQEAAMRELRTEWQAVAEVLDRVFFFSYVIAIVLSLVFIFPHPN